MIRHSIKCNKTTALVRVNGTALASVARTIRSLGSRKGRTEERWNGSEVGREEMWLGEEKGRNKKERGRREEGVIGKGKEGKGEEGKRRFMERKREVDSLAKRV